MGFVLKGEHMAMIECKECKKSVSSTAKTCPNCGAKNKRGVPWWAWVVGIPSVLFAGALIIGATTSREMSQYYAKQQAAEEACGRMKRGADTGSQRLLADRMCDELKRRVEDQKPMR